ncbi:RHS repeat-associated core domain-containing protein [Actinomycetota bacterium]
MSTASGTVDSRAAFESAGNLVTQKMPGGLVQTSRFDEAGEPLELAYSGQVTPVTESTDPETGETVYTPGTPVTDVWVAWHQVNDITGRVVREWTGQGAAVTGTPGVTDPADPGAPAPVGKAYGFDRSATYDTHGRLTTRVSRTATGTGLDATPDTALSADLPCTVTRYVFDDNGRRTKRTVMSEPGGDCFAAETPSNTTTTGYTYDGADRPTTAATTNGSPGAGGSYVYDSFGRQTTLPAGDAPDPAKGNITLGYFADDLPRSIAQGGVTTTYQMTVNNRRATSTTVDTTAGAAATTTRVRHYTDTSDNPAWVVTTTADGATATDRFVESIGGDLGATIHADGAVELAISNIHDDVATTVTIPADQTDTTAATGIGGWADYTEYGTPTSDGNTSPGADPEVSSTTSPAVATVLGYGWLGAKQRSTTPESAGLTLMGDRLYNPVTGNFTSRDPEYGGNTTTYTYPQDPINNVDLDGHWGWKKWAKRTAGAFWRGTGRASRWLTSSKWLFAVERGS